MLPILLTVWNFLTKYYKIILPILAVIVLYFSFTHYISSIKKEAYNNGVQHQIEVQAKDIAREDASNRKFEKLLRNIIEQYGVAAVNKALDRVKEQTLYQDKIKTVVLNNPIYKQCIVDKEVLEYRNKIRAQGPSITIEIPKWG